MTDTPPEDGALELTVIVVSYNTRALTLKCLETLYDATREVAFETILFDNASSDGSADAVADAFPQVRLVRSGENLGFARANNEAAKLAGGAWLLLLNPDTEVHDGAIDRLIAFAKAHPQHGIYGGRTVFPDGSLNIASCWNRITPWSAFCMAVGLTALFKRSALFNPEGMGAWRRDSVREVDIVVGCFFLIPRALWRELEGFDTRYYMYGEEADLCLRAAARGWRPVITPDATIMHLVGAASATRAAKVVQVAKARTTLIDTHWRPGLRGWGRAMMWLWGAMRYAGSQILALAPGRRHKERRALWRAVWRERRDWMASY